MTTPEQPHMTTKAGAKNVLLILGLFGVLLVVMGGGIYLQTQTGLAAANPGCYVDRAIFKNDVDKIYRLEQQYRAENGHYGSLGQIGFTGSITTADFEIEYDKDTFTVVGRGRSALTGAVWTVNQDNERTHTPGLCG